MRVFIFICFLMNVAVAQAQTFLPGSFIDNNYRGSLINNIHVNDTSFKKKWFFSSYSGISTSLSFLKGGSATIVSAPIGLQLNHKLNNNLYAFAGVSAAPSYVNFRSAFLNADLNKNAGNAFRSSSLGLYSRAELGLQYINDEKTFSISGSIGVERSSFPMPVYNSANFNQTNTNAYIRK